MLFALEWNALEVKTFAPHVKMRLVFKGLHKESCCAAYCNISGTRFQILVGGRDSDQHRLVFVFTLMSTVTCAPNTTSLKGAMLGT